MTGICTIMTQVFGSFAANGLGALWRNAFAAQFGRFRATDWGERQRGTGGRRP